MVGPHLVLDPLGVQVAHAGGPAPGGVEGDAGDPGLGSDLEPAGAQRPAQQRHRVALGVDRAAVPAAEPAVVAGRPAVVGHRVDAGRAPGRDAGRPARRPASTARRRTCRARAASGYGTRAPRRERVGLLARHADDPLDLGVVGLQVVVGEGPVGHRRRPSLGAEGGQQAEVVLAEAGELGVGVVAAAADGGGQRVDVADHQVVAVVGAAPVGAGLDQGVGAEQVAVDELDLVVGQVAERLVGRVQVEQVVAALLQHDHRPARLGQHLGHGRARRPRSHDHGIAVEVGHVGWVTSSVGPAAGLDVAVEGDGGPGPRRRGCRRRPGRRTGPRRRARTAARGTRGRSTRAGGASARRRRASAKSGPGRPGRSRYRSCQPMTGPLNSRSGRPWDPSMRVRQASSSRAPISSHWSKPASPPWRPEKGPPAKSRGGSNGKAPSSRST